MTNVQKFGIDSVIKLLEDNILKEDVINTAIFYLREYEEKKDELDELIKKETLETQKAVRITSILTKIFEKKANATDSKKCTKLNCPFQFDVISDNCDEKECLWRTE